MTTLKGYFTESLYDELLFLQTSIILRLEKKPSLYKNINFFLELPWSKSWCQKFIGKENKNMKGRNQTTAILRK